MAVVIRYALQDDLIAILSIYNEAILNTTAVYYELPHTVEMRLAWFNDKLKQGFPVFVAVADGQVVGFGSYGSFRSPACYRSTVEHSVYVDASKRGKGIGKALLQTLIDTARQSNYHAMIAGIDAQNRVSIQLHTSLGFEQVAHFKQVGFKFGHWLDLFFLELIL